MNRTHVTKPASVERKWYVVDATNQPIGRLAGQVAQILRGKHKPTFAYNVDVGDFVVVVNAAKAIWTGGKGDELLYWHSGWPGGLKNVSRADMLAENPVKMIEKVVWGMLPKGPLGKQTFSKLKVYKDADHPHEAQQPEPLEIGKRK